MSTTYEGDETNNPNEITIPSDGDLRNVSSVNVAFEALKDITKHILEGATAFTGVKTFASIIAGALEMSAHILTSAAPPTDRFMVWKIALGGMYARFYSRKRVASGPPVYAAGIELTINAAWDEVSSKWIADDDTKPARMYEFGGHPGAVFEGDDTVLRFKRKQTTTVDWSYDAWDLVSLGLGSGNPTATSGAVAANTFFSKALPKAWGRVLTDGVGAVSIVDGYGLAGAIIDTGIVRVELRNAMANSNYCVVATAKNTDGAPIMLVEGMGTTTFDLNWLDPAGADIDAASNALTAMFVVFGEQS